MSAVDADTHYDEALDAWCDARNEFGRLRRWPGLDDGAEAIEREEVRAAAEVLRDVCDRLADMPERAPGGQWTGACFARKRFVIADLVFDAAAFKEPRLLNLAMRFAERSIAAHPEEYSLLEEGETQ